MMQPPARAVPFIAVQPGGALSIEPAAAEFLGTLPGSTRLNVISIAGKYRTGKSFFINRVLLEARPGQGFQVGSSIEACTKGLWLWTGGILGGGQDSLTLLIDTEGFGGVEESATYDSKIFIFALLLSSIFIFNSVGNIDEPALNTIDLVLNLARQVQGSSTRFPLFYWVLRDFSLQMTDRHGRPISEKEYLERSLELFKGDSEQVEAKNRIRTNFKQFFQRRELRTIVIPAEHERDLKRLDQLSNHQLRPEFLSKASFIRKEILQSLQPLQFQGRALNGRSFLQLAKFYVEEVNSGKIPNLQGTWTHVSKAITQQVYKDCLMEFEKQLNQMPEDQKKYDVEVSRIRKQTIYRFQKEALVDVAERNKMMAELNVEVTDRAKQKKETIREKLAELYQNIIEQAICPIKETAEVADMAEALKVLREKLEKLPDSEDKW